MSFAKLNSNLVRLGAASAALLAPAIAFAQEAAPAPPKPSLPLRCRTRAIPPSCSFAPFSSSSCSSPDSPVLWRSRSSQEYAVRADACTVIGSAIMLAWFIYGYSFAFGGSTNAFFGGFGKCSRLA